MDINQNEFSIFKGENVFSDLILLYIYRIFHCIPFRNKCWKKETWWLQGNLLDATLKIAAFENYQLSTTKGVMESIRIMTLIEN